MVPTVLRNGQNIILWASVNATIVTDNSGALTTTLGYKFVSPLQTTSYTYGFTGPGGTTLCSTTVTVGAPIVVPPPVVVVAPTPAFVNGTQALSVSMLPLLAGGQTGAGASVPVAYIKVTNRGTGTASIKGFSLNERGTASAETDVIGFTTSDDKGGSRTTIGGIEGTKAAAGERAFVPLAADLAPGQIRIFTIKALLSATHHEAGKTLVFDVASVDTSANVSAAFPLSGVTWFLTY